MNTTNTTADSGFRAALRRHRLQKVHTPGDFRAVAQKRLPKMVFDYIDGGAGQELSIRENRAAIEEIRLVPSAPHDVSACDMSVSLLGETLSLPIIIGPTGLASASWPKGEIEFAKAAARHGTRYVMPNASSVAPDAVARAGSGNSWFQLYPPPDRELARKWVAQARDAGFTGLEVTVDVAAPGQRHRDSRNGFVMPFRWSPGKALDCAARPVWAMKMLYHGQPTPYLQVDENKKQSEGAANQSESRKHRFTRALSWDLLKLVRDEWQGPLLVKGLVDPRQASLAVQAGYDGIVISNHGGRQLDSAISPMEVLPEFRAEVSREFPLLVDGGFRSGVDVCKAIASGATAVQLGRVGVFALATAGGAGLDHMFALFRSEIENTMALCGVTRLDHLGQHSIRRRP
ncbi:alpha-hydroxy acid oxidase [Aquamicrobium zhengzhouense]|uniref:Alpha-hydroxy-acid oxidizing protein n=1 Tax=Aquamicrobium zhengzhouense TaxID=2781738 RepID=A0ABS0SGL7_9HYPH|nr:alpha-hydroxy acid oxidase [Aquamicrobium zhengzhouense]MBI1622416.1 alpha-hydroxy-acid oxidizing protein [Aquamicrobium zhengzhouense]